MGIAFVPARGRCTSSQKNRQMIRFRSLFAVALASLLVLFATPAIAQVCLGIPMTMGQTAVGLTASFPENANAFGIDGRHKLTDQLVLGAGYTLGTYDEDAFGGEDIPSSHTISVSGAYEFLVPTAPEGPQLGLCPNVGAQYTTWDELTMYAVPVGVGVGTALELGQGSAVLAPYVNPSLVFGKAKLDEAESDWENDFGFTLGANVIVTNLHFGAAFSKIGDGDGVFGVRAGMIF